MGTQGCHYDYIVTKDGQEVFRGTIVDTFYAANYLGQPGTYDSTEIVRALLGEPGVKELRKKVDYVRHIMVSPEGVVALYNEGVPYDFTPCELKTEHTVTFTLPIRRAVNLASAANDGPGRCHADMMAYLDATRAIAASFE